MAQPSTPVDAKLICGMICRRGELFAEAIVAMVERFGPVDMTSDVMDFDFTHYYDGEMGSPLARQFVAFGELVRPDSLAEVKLATNAIEADFATRHADMGVERPINLDPGYIEPIKLVLASMKNFSHRIYLGSGVYGEVTLRHRTDHWEPLPWTFPDFASGRYFPFLSAARGTLPVMADSEGASC